MRVGPMEKGGIDIIVDGCLIFCPFYLILVRPRLPLWSRSLFSSMTCGFTLPDLVGLDQRRASDGSHGQSTGRLLPCLPCTDPILHAPRRLSHSSCKDTRSIAIVHGSLRPPRVVEKKLPSGLGSVAASRGVGGKGRTRWSRVVLCCVVVVVVLCCRCRCVVVWDGRSTVERSESTWRGAREVSFHVRRHVGRGHHVRVQGKEERGGGRHESEGRDVPTTTNDAGDARTCVRRKRRKKRGRKKRREATRQRRQETKAWDRNRGELQPVPWHQRFQRTLSCITIHATNRNRNTSVGTSQERRREASENACKIDGLRLRRRVQIPSGKVAEIRGPAPASSTVRGKHAR